MHVNAYKVSFNQGLLKVNFPLLYTKDMLTYWIGLLGIFNIFFQVSIFLKMMH